MQLQAAYISQVLYSYLEIRSSSFIRMGLCFAE